MQKFSENLGGSTPKKSISSTWEIQFFMQKPNTPVERIIFIQNSNLKTTVHI